MWKSRKLQFEILGVFLFLIIVSLGIISTFTYSKTATSLRNFSQSTIERVSTLIINRIKCMMHDLERLPEMGKGFFLRHPQINKSNQELIFYFLEVVKFHPNFYAYYVGAPNGSALIVFNLSLAEKPHFFSDPSRPVPEGTQFALILTDPTQQPPFEEWIYYDKNLKAISDEKVTYGGFDPRIRPWYVGAKAAGKLFWTDVFNYDPTEDPGIAVANPIYNEAGELIAVIGADLSLKLFSNFVKEQKVGRTGSAFILNSSGDLILPLDVSYEHKKLITNAYSSFLTNKSVDFSFKMDGNDYLGSVHPFPLAFGKEWQVLVIDPLSDFFSDNIRTQREVLLISIVVLVFATVLVIYLSNHISAPIVTLSKEVDKISHLDLESDQRVKSDIEEINLIDASIANLRVAIRSFSRYVPKEVVKLLMQRGREIELGGDKKEITILFSDIVDFTKISESLPIDTVLVLLGDYFNMVSKVIMESQGTIDKYIGDSVMAFWGAPQEDSNQASRACLAALQIQKAVEELNEKHRAKNIPEFHTRIGINSGNVIVGNLGASERMNYTAIGDPVNTASRLESLNRVYRTKILITEEVWMKIGDGFLSRPLDIVEIRGKKKRIKIFELVSEMKDASSLDLELCRLFAKAFDAMFTGDKTQAKALFQDVLQKYPNDYPTQMYLHGKSWGDFV